MPTVGWVLVVIVLAFGIAFVVLPEVLARWLWGLEPGDNNDSDQRRR